MATKANYLSQLQHLETELTRLHSGLWWHWLRSSSAKTVSAGASIACVGAMVFFPPAVVGTAVVGGVTGVGASVGDWVHEELTTGGLARAYKEAADAIVQAIENDSALAKAVGAVLKGTQLAGKISERISNISALAQYADDAVAVTSGVSHAGRAGVGAAQFADEAVAAGQAAQAGRTGVAASTAVRGASSAVVGFAAFGAVISTAVAVHSWASSPPSYREVANEIEAVKVLVSNCD